MLLPKKEMRAYVMEHVKGHQLSYEYDYRKTLETQESVTVAFIDICNFSNMSFTHKPLEIAHLLHTFFTQIEMVIACHPTVIKIETIGDCIVIAQGIESTEKYPMQVFACCKHILNRVKMMTFNSDAVHIRIGMATGVVATGVVGFMTPRMCLFGEPVILAARLQALASPNEIKVTDELFKLITVDSRLLENMTVTHETCLVKGMRAPILMHTICAIEGLSDTVSCTSLCRELSWKHVKSVNCSNTSATNSSSPKSKEATDSMLSASQLSSLKIELTSTAKKRPITK